MAEDVRQADREDLAELLASCEAAQAAGIPWWQVARAVRRVGSARTVLVGPWDAADRWERDVAAALATHLSLDAIGRWAARVDEWKGRDPSIRFLTILDEDYPPTLRSIFNPPPFITVRGNLLSSDARGVAVVGTRRPSTAGLKRAHRLGRELAEASVAVVSGLALGIDAAAHEGALEAGGRAIAVLGHGLLQPIYPPQNRDLAGRIVAHGALVSQFRPDTPPSRATFPMRNVVTSGLAQGTVVVEASHTSGARQQARFAAEHGRRVWLLRSLVEGFGWARAFVDRYPESARVVDDVSDVLCELRDADAITAVAQAELPSVPDVEATRRPEPEPLRLFALV